MQNTLDLSVDTGSLVIDLKNERGRKIGEFEIIPTDTDILKRYEKVVDFFNNVSFGENVTEKEIIKIIERNIEVKVVNFFFIICHLS